jgi:uracil-DNA glycosylase family protein
MARAKNPHPTAVPFIPPSRSLPVLRDAVQGCRGCDLYRDATQAVFGAGAARARIMIVGETPGDAEDRAGKPFVGPAGRLLDDALAAAGVPRAEAYVTNVVKHFRFIKRGKRRIHDKPDRYQIEACKPWLGAELEVVHPEILVLLGATAAQALLGASFRVTRQRGVPIASAYAAVTIATVHPSSVLRAPDDAARAAARAAFVADLSVVGDAYRRLGKTAA